MSKASELVAELAGQGEVDSSGGFSLDRERARTKMRQFQLADPRRYVLALVEAAVLKGANEVRFQIDADDVRVEFNGAPFDAADMDELYTSLFVKGGDPRLFARRELAVALNAAMGLNPRHVTLTSANAQGVGVRAILSGDAEDRIQTDLSGLPSGTRIHVRERFRAGLLVEFVRSLGDARVEHKLLASHCEWSLTPVFVDGKPVSSPLSLSRLHGAVRLEGEGFKGVAGFDLEGGSGACWWPMSNGVKMRKIAVPQGPKAFRAYVDATGLRKDVSRSRLAGGPTLDRVSAAVTASIWPALGNLARALLSQERAPGRIAPELAWHAAAAQSQLVHALAVFAQTAQVRRIGADHPLRPLLELKIWPSTEGELFSSRELALMLDRDQPKLRYLIDQGRKPASHKWKPDSWGPVLRLNRFQEKLLADLFGTSAVTNARASLKRAWQREQARRRWKARKSAPRLEAAAWFGRAAIDDGRIVGEVGIRGSGRSVVRIIAQGCVLGELPMALPGIDGVVAVVSGPFNPKISYADVYRDNWFARALVAVARALPTAIGRSGTLAASQALGLLVSVSRGDPALHLLGAMGFSDKSARRWLEEVEGEGAFSDDPPWRARIVRSGVFDIPVLDTLDGAKVSMREIVEAARTRKGGVWTVQAPRATTQGVEPAIVVVEEWSQRLLAAFFGTRSLVSVDIEIEGMLAERGFMQRPSVAMQPEPGYGQLAALVSNDFGRARVVLETGHAGGLGGVVEVEVLHQGRVLHTVAREGPWPPGVVARVEAPGLKPTRFYDGIEGDLEPIDMLVSEGVAAILADALEAGLAAAGPHRGAEALAMQQLLMLFPQQDRADRLWRLAGDSQPQATDTAKFSAFADERPAAWAPLLRLLPIFLTRPLFTATHVQHERLSLWQLHRARAGEGTLGWWTNSAARHSDETRRNQIVYALSELELEVLNRLFAPDLQEASEWLERHRQEQALLAKPQLHSIALDPATTCVRLAFEFEGLRGEIGLPSSPPGAGVYEATVTICHLRRPVETLALELGLPALALVDSDDVVVDGRGAVVRDAAVRSIQRTLEQKAKELLELALGTWNEGGDSVRAALRPWLTWAAIDVARNEGRSADERLLDLPLFRDVDGAAISLREAMGPLTAISYVSAVPHHVVRPGSLVLHLRPHEQALFVNSGITLLDYSRQWKELEQGRVRREQARALDVRRYPSWSPTKQVQGQQVAGTIWFCPANEEPELWLGSAGKFIETMDLDLLRLARMGGVLEVPPSKVDNGFTSAWVDDVSPIEDAANALLEDAILRVAKPDEMQTERATENLREALRKTACALARLDNALERSPRLASWLQKLLNVPLFRVESGHVVSLKWLRGARPAEWAGRGLWSEYAQAQWLEAFDAEGMVNTESGAPPSAPDPVPPPLPSSRSSSPWFEHLEPESEPEPEPELTPEERMLERVREELRMCRTGNPRLLTDSHLAMIRTYAGPGSIAVEWVDGILVDTRHPVVKAAVTGGEEDSVLDSFVTSAVFRALNVGFAEISDADELAFCRVHSSLLSSAAKPN